MNTYYHLEDHTYKPIEDRHFTSDERAYDVFHLLLAKHEYIRDVINEHLTYIGPIPEAYKDQILYQMF